MDRLAKVVDLRNVANPSYIKKGDVVWAHGGEESTIEPGVYTYKFSTLTREYTTPNSILTKDGVGAASGIKRVEFLN